MKQIIYSFAAVIIIILLFVLAGNPKLAANAGELNIKHAGLVNSCESCHATWHGVPNSKCIKCHGDSGGMIKTKSARKGIIAMHSNMKNKSCIDCHTEHNGKNALLTSMSFDHNSLSDALVKDCTNCHDKPIDNMHASFSNDCRSCHNWSDWKNASIEHDKYFIFDSNHPSDCSNCHLNKNTFKEYTCYNCHEHSEDRIASKHMKEGISDFENCVKCHRSGNKHDAEGGEGGDHERSSGNEGGGKREHGEHHDGGDED